MLSREFKNVHPFPAPSIEARECCIQCGVPLSVTHVHQNDDSPNAYKIGSGWYPGSPIGWAYKSAGHFCTVGCAVTWGNRVVDICGDLLQEFKHPNSKKV